MTKVIIVLAVFTIIVIWTVSDYFKSKKSKPQKSEENLPIPTFNEINQIELPVTPDPEPYPSYIPLDDEGEMPIKPPPPNCQKAIFRAAPATFIYTDCCGEIQQGEGFQPWEKRAPVSIDVNQYFEGMDLLGEDGEIDC